MRRRWLYFLGWVMVTVTMDAYSGETHRCLVDGKIIITNVTCEFIGNATDLSPPIPDKHFKRGEPEEALQLAKPGPMPQPKPTDIADQGKSQINSALWQLLNQFFKMFVIPFLLITLLVAWLTRKTKKSAQRFLWETLRNTTRQTPAYARPERSKLNASRNALFDRREPHSEAGGQEMAMAAPKPTDWSLALIRELEWKRFEDVCQKFYEQKGIRSETTPLGPDGGIDIRLYQDDSGMPTAIVQCKAWGERVVGVKPIRELLGVMTHEKIGKAFFMTSGVYSEDAKAVACANRITLIDGSMLLTMIQRLPMQARESLLAFAIDGDYQIPTCPSCGVKMEQKKGSAGRPDFWGCRNYPNCRQILGMRRS